VNVFDDGASVVVKADVPGLTNDDLGITLHDGVLSITGKRKDDAPEGYTVHRRERGAYELSRSFRLPVKVDAEKTTAEVKNGVLTVTLAKAVEAQPRRIAVRG
jgi:HSP20 family protein